MYTKTLYRVERLIAFGALILFFALINAKEANAQNVWDQCTDGRSIVRCETYDCPNGDVNNDGKCTLDDEGARLTDVRNDSFCSNPISGCGEVRYYSSGDNSACSVRVEENNKNCDLYNISEPTFTPAPTSTPNPPIALNTSTGTLVCSALIATPSVGFTPLEVKFEVKASGDVSQIKNYEFKIEKPDGSNSGTVVQSNPNLTQTFSESGKHNVSVTILTKDELKITSQNCEKDIIVSQRAIGGGGTSTNSDDTLPETGSPIFVGFLIFAFGIAGVYIYDKYRFI